MGDFEVKLAIFVAIMLRMMRIGAPSASDLDSVALASQQAGEWLGPLLLGGRIHHQEHDGYEKSDRNDGRFR